MTEYAPLQLSRRSFLQSIGLATAAAAVPAVLLIEPEPKKLWFVGSNAPVGSRIEVVQELPTVAAVNYQGVSVRVHPMVQSGHAWDLQIPGKPREILVGPREYEALVRAVNSENERSPRDRQTGVTMIDRVEIQDGRWNLKKIDRDLARFGAGRVRTIAAGGLADIEATLLNAHLEVPEVPAWRQRQRKGFIV